MEKNKVSWSFWFSVGFGYFTFGAITNVAGAIVPKIRETYNVSASLSIVLAAVFFIAYGLTSLPWGFFMTEKGKKKALIYSTLVTILGVLMFASIPGFIMNMIAMFLCGVGVTGIQVVLNPLVNDISDSAKYSRNLTICMVLMGAGSYMAPQLVTLIKSLSLPWTFSYWVFSILGLIMLAAIATQKFPKISAQEAKDLDNEQEAKPVKSEAKEENLVLQLITKEPLIYLYALGIFLYVGVEVGIANSIGFYLEDKFEISKLMGESAEAVKNTAVSNYWGALLLGRLISSAYLDKISNRLAIKVHAALALVFISIAVTATDVNMVLWSLPAVAFCISIMFPTIYSLTTNNFEDKYSDPISSVLCTAIIGGAFIGPLIAKVAEATQGSAAVPSWDTGFIIAFVCYAYLFVVSLLPAQKSNILHDPAKQTDIDAIESELVHK